MAGTCLRSRLCHSGAPIPALFPEASWRPHATVPAIYLPHNPGLGTPQQLQGTDGSRTYGQSRSEYSLSKIKMQDRVAYADSVLHRATSPNTYFLSEN